MENLKNKIIVVPGETGRIGSATCRLLQEQDVQKHPGVFVSVISCGPVHTKMLDLEAGDERSTMACVNVILFLGMEC